MPRYDEPITALLRAIVWDQPCPIDPALLRLPELWRQAHRQSMAHMLAVWALNHGLTSSHDADHKQRIFFSLQRRERQNRLLTELVTLLRSHDIEPVLLKGYAIALLYPNPDMRDFCDVDLYIGERDYDRMITIIRTAYPTAFWFSAEHAGLHFTMVLDPQSDLIAEMHRVPMEFASMPRANRALQDFTLEQMQHTPSITVNGTDVHVPNPTYNALYVFLHAWHHFASRGVGLRQLADWMLVLHTAAAEPELEATLLPLLRRMHILCIWQTFGWVLVNRLGLPLNEFPCYDASPSCARRGEQLYRQLLKDGHGGREERMRLCGDTLYAFPYQRPEHGRLRQKTFTFLRLLFEAVQMSKLFPRFAWRRFFAALFHHNH